jgi:oxygen-independent coproporphyrinogen-3 oxidase
MKLIFSQNQYKYEIEAVMKLFFPAQKFEFLFTERSQACDGDYVFVRKCTFGRGVLLYVYASVGGKSCRRSSMLSADASDSECETELSRLAYRVLSKITGITAEWGVLTGVRPVKQVNRMLEKGMTRDEIFSVLQNKYFVDKSKCEIAYDTALSQAKFLKRIFSGDGKTFGLYISIPFCPTRCSYCSFISQSASGKGVTKIIPLYVENLCEEIRYTAKITERMGLKPDTVYFGGGTPTSLTAAQLDRIMKTLAESFDLSFVKEYTVEAGRPDTITEDKLRTIAKNGCTRISVNPQTLNDSVLAAIGRNHTVRQFYDGFELARSLGFGSINTDIIAGLPTDTLESFKATVDGLIRLSPESITVHTLSIKRSARLNMSDEKKEVLKNPAKEMVDYAASRLYSSGYKPCYLYRQKNMVENLENIGWVKSGYESLYNIYIMEEVQTIIALGAAGSTKLIDLKNSRLERVFNYKYPLDYNNNFELMLKRKEEIERFYAE